MSTPVLLVLIGVYVACALVMGGYLSTKITTCDGADGLIPIFGGLFWWFVLIAKILGAVVFGLFSLGKMIGHKTTKMRSTSPPTP